MSSVMASGLDDQLVELKADFDRTDHHVRLRGGEPIALPTQALRL
jgi:hypothetical protein